MKKTAILALILIGIAAGVLLVSMWRKPVTIAFVGELSGENAQMSVESREAFLYVVDQYNKAGGLLGRKIEPYVVDDQNDNSYSQDILRDLKERGIHFIIGFNLSYMTPTIKKLAADGSFLIISPTVTTDELSGLDDMFIKMSPSNAKQLDALYPVLEEKKLKRMLIIYDRRNEPYTKGVVKEMLADVSKNHGEVVAQVGIQSMMSPEELKAQLGKTTPDSVLMVLNGEDAGKLVQMARITGFQGPILLSVWSQTGDFLENVGRYTNDLYFSGIANDYPDPEAYQFFAAHIHEKTKKMPDFSHTRAYNATKILFDCIIKSQSFEPVKVKAAILNQASFQGIDTALTLDMNGDRVGGYELLVIDNGKFVRAK